MHKLLQRQLKKSGATVDEKFLKLVDEAYKAADEDRELLERSLEISSQEMRELYEQIQKQAAEKVAQSQAKLDRVLFELRFEFFFYSYDKDYVITYLSDGVENALGYLPNELIGRKFTELCTSETLNKETLEFIQEILNGEHPGSRIFSIYHKNGSVVYLEVDSYPLYDNNGKIIGAEGLAKDVTKSYLTQQKLDYLSNHDSLTGLLNRHALYTQLEYLMKDSKRHRESFALFYIDLDNFKAVNDTLGHKEGDALLVKFAQLLQSHARVNDLVARIGEDEFILIYTDVNKQKTQALAQKLIASINSDIVPYYKEQKLSASIGIANHYPKDEIDIQDLLKNADQAMYKAKNSGKNSIAYF